MGTCHVAATRPARPRRRNRRSHARRSPQCRDRYNNHAHPELDHSPCRPEEVPLFIELHKKLHNQWTEIALGMSRVHAAAAAAGAAPGTRTRRSENWVKNVFYSKMRKTHKDESDAMWAPLYAYQAAGGMQAPGDKRARAAEAPGAEEAEAEAAVQRRSTRVTKRPRYDDYIESEEEDEEDEEPQQQQAEDALLPSAPSVPSFMHTMFPAELPLPPLPLFGDAFDVPMSLTAPGVPRPCAALPAFAPAHALRCSPVCCR